MRKKLFLFIIIAFCCFLPFEINAETQAECESSGGIWIPSFKVGEAGTCVKNETGKEKLEEQAKIMCTTAGGLWSIDSSGKGTCKSSEADQKSVCSASGGFWFIDSSGKGTCKSATGETNNSSNSGEISKEQEAFCTARGGTISKDENGQIICNASSKESEEQNALKSSDKSTIKCGDIDGIPAGLPKFTHNLLDTLKYLVPVLLIIMGMIDFARAVIASDEKQMKEAQQRFIRRIIGAIMVFLTVVVVQFVFSMAGKSNTIMSCIDCFVNNKCNSVKNYYEKSCGEYKSEASCPIRAENGSTCVWNKSEKVCQSSGQAKYCADYKTENDCKTDDYGYQCKWTTENGGRPQCVADKEGKYCSDYKTENDCKIDDHGYQCKWTTENGGRPQCVADKKGNVVD